MLVIDTFAWVEYFRGSAAGRKIRRKIEAGGNLVPTIVLAEISKRFTDLRRSDLDEKIEFVRSKSTVLTLDAQTAIEAGRIRSNIGVEGIGLADCILVAVARAYNARVLTGDRHFKGMPEADYFTI